MIAFTNSLQNEFVWDDFSLIVDNPKINLSLKEVPLVFTMPLWELAGFPEDRQVYYRPIVFLFFVLNYKVWGLNPLGFHLTHIILHLINAILLYRIALLLLGSDNITHSPIHPFTHSPSLIALASASIFAVHPIHNESVGRVATGEVIFGFFIILSLYFFLKEKRYLSWITFSFALLSKESAVMLPFALVILATHREGIKKGLIAIIPYMILVGAYLIIRTQVVDTVFGDKIPQPIVTRILTMAVATFDYIRLLLVPYPVSPYYPARWYASIFEPKVLIAIVVLALISYLAFKMRRDKVMLFLLSFPFIMLAPVIWRVNTFPISGERVYLAERFLYVPVMAFVLFIAASLMKSFKDTTRTYLVICLVAVTIIFTAITRLSTGIWRNDITLFERIIEKTPNAAFAHNNLGLAYYTHGRLNEAIQGYLIALRLRPDHADAHYNLGLAYYEQRRFDEAVKEYLTALKIKPDDAKVHSNLGNAYMNLGLIDDAIRSYQTALQLNPNLAITHNNLGLAYQQKGFINEAREEFRKAIEVGNSPVEAR
jgi:tetratricopeptide (TPR) repeat protein